MSKSQTDGVWHRWTPSSATLPVDAVAVVAFLVAANGVLYSPFVAGTAVRALVGFPLLFFVPGYAVVASLFPGCETTGSSRLDWRVVGDGRGSTLRDRGVDWRERLALSFGTSVALLPLVALGLSLAGFVYSLGVVSATLSGVTVLGMTVAVVRRNRLPARQRFQVPYRQWASTIDDGVFGRDSTLDAALNVALAVVVLVSVAGVGYAVATPNHGESYTSATLLTENASGELTASDYPDTLDQSGESLVVRLENHEGATTDYTVVGQLQHVRQRDGSTTVVRRGEVFRASPTVEAGQAWSQAHTVEPVLAGEDLRLVYYVYEGDAPATPSTETAYRHVHVWVDAPASADD